MALSINTAIPLPQATVGLAYSKTLSATGGTPPYTWTVDAGYTVPDRRNVAANSVIDPTMVKDSTAGLQNYINSTPTGADITLPFDLQINGHVVLSNGRILRSTNGSALRKTLSYPWRPSGGTCCQWQYDAKGGRAAEPESLKNHYWIPGGTLRQVNGCSVTAGGTTVTTTTPNGFKPLDNNGNVINLIGAQLSSPTGAVDDATRIVTVASNGLSVTINIPAISAGTNTAFFVKPGSPSTGSDWGGFSGTTGQSGVDYDGLHLTDRYRAPFNSSHIGQAIQVVKSFGGSRQFYNKTITAVSGDGKTVFFSNADGKSDHESSCGTVAWAITARSKVWTATFQPNPSWNPQPFNGGANNPWEGYIDCLQACIDNAADATIQLNDTAKLIGVEIEGANSAWGNGIPRADLSNPVMNEFHRLVRTITTSNVVSGCHLHHTWGDCEWGPGQLLNTRMEFTGMGCCMASFSGKRINGCVLHNSHHGTIDIEQPGGGANSDVQIVNNCFGGPNGIAWSTPINGFLFQGNHSVQADVNAGTITSIVSYLRGSNWSGGGSAVQILNNRFDKPQQPNDPAYEIVDVNGLTVTGNTCPTTNFFLHPVRCTNVSSTGNNGGPNCLGQVG